MKKKPNTAAAARQREQLVWRIANCAAYLFRAQVDMMVITRVNTMKSMCCTNHACTTMVVSSDPSPQGQRDPERRQKVNIGVSC